MKKSVIVLLVIAVFAALIYSQRAPIAARIFATGIEVRMNSDRIGEFDDGLHLALCGAGGPLPAPNASGPCVLVVAGEQIYLVDSGTDGVRNVNRMGFQPDDIEAVFLTHFHSDHIDGLGETATVRWAGGANTAPLPVYGPPGVERVVNGFNESYAQDFVYRNTHHGDTVAPLSGAGLQALAFDMPEDGELVSVLSDGDLKVEALLVDHLPVEPAVGYRFNYKDRSLLITGDTDQSDNITRLAEGVDLLVHEALAPNLVGMMREAAKNNGNEIVAKIADDILNYHASPTEAAETARDAGVGHLLYYHIVPPLIIPGQEALFLDGAEDIFPDYTVGRDGTTFSLPAGSSDIVHSQLGL